MTSAEDFRGTVYGEPGDRAGLGAPASPHRLL
jgi:hypothetical protein